MFSRRQFTTRAGMALVGLSVASVASLARPAAASGLANQLEAHLASIEQEVGGRLGVAVLDAETGAAATHRGDERFPLCSTFKLLAAGAVLEIVDQGEAALTNRIIFERSELVPYSPATEKRTGHPGMSLAELCEAAITLSDNTAANLLLRTIGGPAGLTRFARSLGDPVTRLDRIEPELNEAKPGDERDTTTPMAMAANLSALTLGDALSPGSKNQLVRWLLANKTGDARLRAGLPKTWRVGDKTGSGECGTANDVAIVWPTERAPLIIAAYLTETAAPAEQRNVALASVARAVASALDRA